MLRRYSSFFTRICATFSLSLFAVHAAYATGYYNFGSHWKGAMNPHRIGAEIVFYSGFTSGLGSSTTGSADGMFHTPFSIAMDSAGNIYVGDQSARISKFNSAGVFQGWIGKIGTSPTGGAAGCKGAALGTVTPGWCTGGTAATGTGDGMLQAPAAILIDSSGNIYVADSGNDRILKYNSAGVFQGWIGKIATSPTGGAAGCSGAAVGTATPGWCTGGTATWGPGNGMLNGPSGIAADSSGYLYVSDSGNHRIVKLDSSGVFQGWSGKISSSPTGGDAGCSGASGVTPGWCKGGTSTSGTGSGMFNSPAGIAIDSAGNLYVDDSQNFRITKHNSSGVFQGWTGVVSTSPTGGAAGCNGAPANNPTPGWCTGGSATTGLSTGALSFSTLGLTLDSSGNLYLADAISGKVTKWNSAGVVQGWIGRVNTQPTGGAAGCSTTAVGSVTPGWCTGGVANNGSGDGMMNYPYGVVVDSSGNILVADGNNHRVDKYTSTGAPVGAIQSIGVYIPRWHQSSTVSFGGSADGMFSGPSYTAIDSAKNLYIADSYNNRIEKFDQVGNFVGWIGPVYITPTGGDAGCSSASSSTPGWCTGGSSGYGSNDGMMINPLGIAVDASNNLYVVDNGNNRVLKYDSSGAFIGWIGKIATSPTGGAAGCSGAAVGSFTPGWCTGGTASSGTGDGALQSPVAVAIDSSGNLLVTDYSNARVNKYTSSGAFVGWVGKIATSPTGGAAGCNGASVGSATPGWCTGGASASGTGDGMMKYPSGIAIDRSNSFYVVDRDNNRILKFNSTGVFQGWTGPISSSPTGGAAGCSGAAIGSLTPGWCKGGAGYSGTGNSVMNHPYGMTVDGSGRLYVADQSNHRVNKFDSSGVYQGWYGSIATSPTGGATGCKGASVGTVTPNWCTGGTSASGQYDGMMNSPSGITADMAGNLHIGDAGNNRVIRISAAGK